MALGGFEQAGRLLEFDQVLAQVASHCRTALGREKVAALEPSEDLLEVATRQQETTETRRYIDGGGALEFGPENDITELIHRAMLGGLLRGDELYAVRAFARAARYDRDELSRPSARSGDDLPLLSSLASNIPELGRLDSEIGAAISPAGEVLDYASPLLGRLRAESRQAQNRLNEIMERNLRRFQRSEVVQEPLITQRNGRMVLLIKTEMRYRVPGIVHDVSDSGATVFVEPMAAVDMGNRWREARLAEEREVERVLRHLTNRVGDTGEDLLLALDIVARLDLDVAKARYSAALRATPPVIGESGEDNGDGERQDALRRLRLSRARHPLLLSQSKSGDVVPISLSLNSERGVLLITGPNAGGKTVALKTVGLLAMMAHAGLHIPAEEARFPGFDGIYADIGDQQSIQESLSTFSSHITNLLGIMRQATGRSLVLVDELGTSTDPEEGAALASAVLRHFQRMGVFLVGTTHQRGVARTVQEHPGMINASVDLDPATLAPTYQLTVGLPGRSYALTIAARLGLPQEIIEDASAGVSPVEQATETLLRELQQERQTVEQLKEEAESSRLAAMRLQQQLEEQLGSVEATKTELVEGARRELQLQTADIVERLQRAERSLELAASAAVTAAAGHIRAPSGGRERQDDLRANQQAMREVQRELDAPNWEPIEIKRTPWQERLKSGDRVYVRGISQPVEVITPPDSSGSPAQAQRVEVLLGTMRARIPVYQLQRLAEGHPTAARQGVYLDRAATRTPAPRRPDPEMDLRGLRVDEAVARVDTALNDAALDGVSLLRIIHGKGTGALRRAIREYLADHPLVEAASEGEGPGGEGVTVAQLR
jgi:DNA mismatch repair protein MutS2